MCGRGSRSRQQQVLAASVFWGLEVFLKKILTFHELYFLIVA